MSKLSLAERIALAESGKLPVQRRTPKPVRSKEQPQVKVKAKPQRSERIIKEVIKARKAPAPPPPPRKPQAEEDRHVKRVRSSARWSARTEWEGAVVKFKDRDGELRHFPWRQVKLRVYIAPSGNEYVQALGTEKADLIVVFKDLPPMRLKRLERSSAHRKARQQDDDVARGLKARAAKQKAKAKHAKKLKKLRKR